MGNDLTEEEVAARDRTIAELRAKLDEQRAAAIEFENHHVRRMRLIETELYGECPKGCGCVTEDDPDRRDCACDGPCCMSENWPVPHAELRSSLDNFERMLWVISRTTMKPADWDATALVVDRSAAYPPGTYYPTSIALYPAPTTTPGDDRWWGPDADFVNDDSDDGGWSLAQCVAILASTTVALLDVDRRGANRDDEYKAAAQAWWDGMAGDLWNEAANVATPCAVCGAKSLIVCVCYLGEVPS